MLSICISPFSCCSSPPDTLSNDSLLVPSESQAILFNLRFFRPLFRGGASILPVLSKESASPSSFCEKKQIYNNTRIIPKRCKSMTRSEPRPAVGYSSGRQIRDFSCNLLLKQIKWLL